MELTSEMLDELKSAITAAVEPIAKERDAAKADTEELRELVVKQGEAIQALGESFKTVTDEHEATREAVAATADAVETIIKFTGANGTPKGLDGEERVEVDEKPVEKSADADLEDLLLKALPLKYGGGGSEVTLS